MGLIDAQKFFPACGCRGLRWRRPFRSSRPGFEIFQVGTVLLQFPFCAGLDILERLRPGTHGLRCGKAQQQVQLRRGRREQLVQLLVSFHDRIRHQIANNVYSNTGSKFTPSIPRASAENVRPAEFTVNINRHIGKLLARTGGTGTGLTGLR
jgi:hypothetical protein